ncbi:MAG: T9SS type A sorting domain-containing protein, partial [Bacteroidota bacterium]|nr:T9SS type A sorting domain-containing protein [Bacteroidota bacterium]
ANASIKEGFLSSQVKIFPNPTTGLIQIESSLFMERIEVLNIQGKKVIETENMRSGSIDLRGLDAGVYLIHVTLENGMVIKKVVKN